MSNDGFGTILNIRGVAIRIMDLVKKTNGTVVHQSR